MKKQVAIFMGTLLEVCQTLQQGDIVRFLLYKRRIQTLGTQEE